MLKKGQHFAGRFEVLDAISTAGGVGIVYEVKDLRVPFPHYALKVLCDDFARDSDARKRFRREAEAAHEISGRSGHVVKVFAVEADDDVPLPWMQMELLQGEDLWTRVITYGPLDLPTARRVLGQLGHAMSAAHSRAKGQPILHLDLKPQNLFIERVNKEDVQEELKVLDFGLSREIMADRTRVQATTQSGTYAWMPPEQHDAKAMLSCAADIWPMGLIAFWVFTGKSYWNTVDDDGATNLLHLMRELGGEMVPASERAKAKGFTGELPDGFDAWFAKCVVEDERARFPDAGVASRELKALLDRALRVSTAPTPREESSRPPPQATQVGGSGLPPKGATQVTPPPPEPPKIVQVGDIARVDVGRASGGGTPPRRSSGRTWLVSIAALGGVALLALCVGQPWKQDAHGDAGVADVRVVAPIVDEPPVTPPRDAGPPCPAGMVHIPGGEFWMGADPDAGMNNASPRHRVRLSAYCIDEKEVTVSQYASCVQAGVCMAAGTEALFAGMTDRDRRLSRAWCNRDRADRANHPVNCVDWGQSNAYCQWRRGTLPTGAQWEFAARGTDGRIHPWGNSPPAANLLNACDRECQRELRRFGLESPALYEGSDGFATTAPVGSFPLGRSPFGVLDLAGNVYEWVEDGYWADPNAELTVDPRNSSLPPGPNGASVSRGGGWVSYDRAWVRAGSRTDSSPLVRRDDVGFRCSLRAFLRFPRSVGRRPR